MINREFIEAELLTYSENQDSYGQVNQEEPEAVTKIEITFHLYSHTQVEDVRFQDVTHVALTRVKGIKDSQKVRLSNNVDKPRIFSILFVNDEGRLAQVFLKED